MWRCALLILPVLLETASVAGRKTRRKRGGLRPFHRKHVFQEAETYMTDDFDGKVVAKDMAVTDMFDRIVEGWPGASYASEELGPGQGKILRVENFVTDEEAAHIIKIGTPGLSQSSGTGEKQADGTFKRTHSEYRTSKNSWLMDELSIDPTVIGVDARISNLTGLYHGNSEHYQVLRYSGTGDEYYKIHSDFIPGHLDLPSGPRLFTMFIYLTDIPSGHGGHTYFPNAAPVGGRACDWRVRACFRLR